MFAIPENLGWLGKSDEGRAWLSSLPTLVAQAAGRWGLRVGAGYGGSQVSYVAPAYRAEHIIGSGSGASLSRRGMLGAAGLLAAAGLADLIRVSGKSSPVRVASDRRALSRLLTGRSGW